MGYRKLENVLVYDHLKEGDDPTYDWEEPFDTWYLGLAGELASEIKCSKITLPMLSREQYDWQKRLQEALREAISLRPQRHVDNFAGAYRDFSKEMFNRGMEDIEESYTDSYTWFSNSDTRKALRKQIEYGHHSRYKPYHYEVDRRGLVLKLPPKVIALVPQDDHFGCLAINEQFFNFFFFQDNIHVYYLRELKIDDEADKKAIAEAHGIKSGFVKFGDDNEAADA